MIFGLTIISLVIVLSYLMFRVCAKQCARDSVVSTWLALAIFVFGATELLSCLDCFKPAMIRGVWCLLPTALIAVALSRRKSVVATLNQDVSGLLDGLKYLYANQRFSLFGAGVILLLTFIHALIAPSFDPDSLGYHLPRATHWLVNGSVEFYETAIARQNFQAPLYSFVLAHLMALTKSDLFLNLIQWMAFIVNSVVLSLIAQELKVGRSGQWIVAVLAVCIPQAISQTIGCVNDLFASTAVMAFVLYLIRFLRNDGLVLKVALQVVFAMGIAFATKYTSLIHVAGLAVPLSIAGLVKIWRRFTFIRMSKFALTLICTVVLGSCFLLPQVTRNLRYYGDPLSGEPPNMMTNVNLTPKKFAVNYIRHLSMHIATPFYALNRPVENVVKGISGELINDPDITYQNKLCFSDYRIFTPLGKYSSNASNPVQFLLYVFLIFMLVLTRFNRSAVVLEYSVAPVLFGSIVYCAVFKFQPWSARLQLPYFMMMVLGIVVWLEQRRHPVKLRKFVIVCSLSYAILHVSLFSDWYMPAFLYGKLPKSSGYGSRASLAQKIRYLNSQRWSAKVIDHMKESVPPALSKGYSIFFTERDRLYIGNQYHDDMYYLYHDCRECMKYLCERVDSGDVSQNVCLLISSDHGNIFPEILSYEKRPFSWEFILWKMADNITGEGSPKFCHLTNTEPAEILDRCFAGEDGLIMSDYSRESVMEQVKQCASVEPVFSNRVFRVYQISRHD